MTLSRADIARLFRFGLVGGTASLLYAVVAYGLIKSGVSNVLSSVFAYAVAIPVSFAGQKYFTFNADGKVPVELSLFLVTQAIGLVLAALIMGVAEQMFSGSPIPAIVCVVIAIPILNFIIMTYVIFPAKNRKA